MKKETIEKLFKRYISIFDDVVYQTSGEHIDQTTNDEINSEVDQLFKEYEHISNLTEFNSFSEKIKSIIDKVLKKSKIYNTIFIEKELRKRFNLFENDPFVYIKKEVDDTISKIIPNSDGDYCIPFNPYLESIIGKGYRVNFESAKILKHIENVKEKYKVEREQMIAKVEEEYKEVLKTALKEINDYPIQFCKETIEKYFYDDWFDKLLKVPNSIKNQNIIKAIKLNLAPHTEEYEEALNCAFISKYNDDTIIKLNSLNPNKYLNDFMNDFRNNNLLSRSKIINDFYEIYGNVYYNNKGLTKEQKRTLKKKFDIVNNNINNILDISFIRFYRLFLYECNLISLKGSLLEEPSNSAFLYNIMNINLTLLINELETIKLDDNGFVLNKKYDNIINEYHNYIEKNKNTLNDENNVGEPIFKISILDSLVDKFNKQYKYKYIFENIKSKFKNIIKINKK